MSEQDLISLMEVQGWYRKWFSAGSLCPLHVLYAFDIVMTPQLTRLGHKQLENHRTR
jgi:hypothetical protein